VASALASALAAAESPFGVIALDDLHAVSDPRAFEFLERLCEALPPAWRLAATCRFEPPMALARLQLEGRLQMLRQEDLGLTLAEVQALLQQQGAAGRAQDPRQLLERTRGWIAGVKLLAGGAMPGDEHLMRSRRHLFEYLDQEVMAPMEPALRDFLLQTSLLSELDASRCAQLTGDHRSARWLEEIERRGLFVSALEGDERMLRLHDLFRDYLQDRLQRQQPERMPALLQRASETEPDLVRRVQLLLRAEHWERAAQALLDSAGTAIEAGASAQLLQLVGQFPAGPAKALPELAYVRGLCAAPRFEFATLAENMREACQGFRDSGRLVLASRALALASSALMLSARFKEGASLWAADRGAWPEPDPVTAVLWSLRDFLETVQFGSHAESARHLEKAARGLRAAPQARQWLLAYNTLYTLVGRAGLRPWMSMIADELSAGGESHPMLRASALQLRAWLALWAGRLEEARALVEEVQSEARWLGMSEGLLLAMRMLKAMDAVLRGDAAAMRAQMRQFVDQPALAQRRTVGVHLCFFGRFSAVFDDWDEVHRARQALQALDQRGELPSLPALQLARDLLHADIALHEGRPEEARRLLLPWQARALDIDAWTLHARFSVALARAALRCGDADGAWQALREALVLARDSGQPLGLMLTGIGALQELADAPWPAPEPALLACLRQVLAAARQAAARPAQASGTDVPEAATQLSGRELEVLRLIARGQSNKLIARQLGLSPHTVKRHVARILDKTAQSTRTGAAAWLRQAERAAAR
jgi:LuxR family maltose regulon positive regulatory protein